MKPSVALDFSNATEQKVSEKIFLEQAELILRRLGRVDRVSIELALVGETTIQRLNKKFLQHDKPTDVLSFPAEASATLEDPTALGSIAISVPTAESQAKQAGISLEQELRTLFGHGLLHLLGYHHR